jgi:hypothetical protein
MMPAPPANNWRAGGQNDMNISEAASQATTKLHEAQLDLFNATERVIGAKIYFENAKAQAIASGQIVGKNAEEREANLRLALATQYKELEEAELIQRASRYNYESAALHRDFVKTQIRLLEIAKEG